MTALIDEGLIERELGPGILRAAKEGRARDVLVLLMTDHADLLTETDAGALFAAGLARKIRAASSDSYLPSGRIGRLNLQGGCYTAYTVFRLVAEDLARRGLARTVSVHLRAGRQTVRDFLTERYGVSIGPRQYFTPRGRTPDQADGLPEIVNSGAYAPPPPFTTAKKLAGIYEATLDVCLRIPSVDAPRSATTTGELVSCNPCGGLKAVVLKTKK